MINYVLSTIVYCIVNAMSRHRVRKHWGGKTVGFGETSWKMTVIVNLFVFPVRNEDDNKNHDQ